MQSLRDLLSPKSDTVRWVAAPAGFVCDSCRTPQEKGTLISWIFHGNGEWERGEWEWNAPDCTQCEINQRASHEKWLIEHSLEPVNGEGQFNDYTREYWQRWSQSSPPTDLIELINWIGLRHDVLQHKKVLAELRPDTAGDVEWGFSLYVRGEGENKEYWDREEVDFYKSLPVPDLPEKPEVSKWDAIMVAALRETEPDHPAFELLD